MAHLRMVSFLKGNDSTIKGKQYWERHSLKVIMNNPGPTHLIWVPQMQALPWIKCRKGLSHPTKEQADSKAQRVRERKTPIYSFTALLSPSDLLSLPPLSYPLPLFLLVVFLNISLTQTHRHSLKYTHSTEFSSFTGTCQATSHFTLLCPWLRGESPAKCSHQTGHRTPQLYQLGLRDLDAPGQSNKINTYFWDGIATFSFIILKSKTNRQLVKRLKWYTWVWNW